MKTLKEIHPGEFFTFEGHKYLRVKVMDEDGPEVNTLPDHLLCARTFNGDLRSLSEDTEVSRL